MKIKNAHKTCKKTHCKRNHVMHINTATVYKVVAMNVNYFFLFKTRLDN